MPAEELLFLEPLGCCLNAMRETIFDKSVAILGAGPIGLLFAQLTKKKGLQTFVLEPLAHRRDVAERVGAEAAIDITEESLATLVETTSGGVGTVISATTNNQRAIDMAFKVARRGGCINFFGLAPAGQEIRVNLEHFHYTGHKLMASWAFSRWSLNESRRLLIGGELDFTPLLTDRYPIDQAVKAFKNARNRRGVKSVLTGA